MPRQIVITTPTPEWQSYITNYIAGISLQECLDIELLARSAGVNEDQIEIDYVLDIGYAFEDVDKLGWWVSVGEVMVDE